jgi:hypothetical protein
LGGGDAWILQTSTADSDTYAMDFILRRTDGRHKASVRDFSTDGYLVAFYENNSVGPGGHAGANALGEPPKVIGQGLAPKFGVGAFGEVPVLEGLPSEFVDDGVDVALLGVLHGHKVLCGQMVPAGRHKIGVGTEWVPVPDRIISIGFDDVRHPRKWCSVGTGCCPSQRLDRWRGGSGQWRDGRGGDNGQCCHPRSWGMRDGRGAGGVKNRGKLVECV